MAKYFVILLVMVAMVIGYAVSTAAMGLNDFVAVADGSSSALFNPAGLANLSQSDLTWEHRFTDRDEGSMDSDDVLIYTAPGNPGFGALFYAYSQDLINGFSPALYWRTTSYGYAYGWAVSDQVNLGLALKGVNLSSYDTATLTQVSYDTSVFFDFGIQMKVDEHFKLGLAVHNIGRNMTDPYFNYETAAGISYHRDKFTAAVELNDYLNEGGNPLYRVGCRYQISESVRPWVYALITENSHVGGSLGLEYQSNNHFKMNLSWFLYRDDLQNIDSIKVMIGYIF